MHTPKLPELVVLKSRLCAEVWAKRERDAQDAETLMEALEAKLEGEAISFSQAVRETMEASKRSWAVRRWPRWKRDGIEGLFDMRQPPKAPMTRACQDLVTGARLANPGLTLDEALEMLTTAGLERLPSVSTVKRLFRSADDRRRYRQKLVREATVEEASAQQTPLEQESSVDVEAAEVEELSLAGAELLRAADQETGAIDALTDAVVALSARVASDSGEDEGTGQGTLRDGGKFTASYNRARRRKKGQPIASYLRPAPERGRKKVAADFGFIGQRRATLERKLGALVYEGAVNPSKGWDGLRSVAGEGLESLVGYAYMPATLQKLASELAQLDAGPSLIGAMGACWHQVAEERWTEPGALAALYVDNHAKEVWSSLFTKAGKVSHRSRVMPCITTTYVQTGVGTPVVVLSHSGASPLAPQLCELVEEAEHRLDQDVRRAVVIDSEGSTFDILASFAKQGRVIVTPCKPKRLRDLELRFSRGSYFRPYREHDELRVATATLRHKSTNREQELGVLLVRRERRDEPMALLTTGLDLGFTGRQLADLYFERWPLQENFFKEGAVIGLDRHRGNSGRMVTNVAVATELEHLEVRLVGAEQTLGQLTAERPVQEQKVFEATEAHSRAADELRTHRQRLDHLVAASETGTEAFASASVAHHQALVVAESTEPALQEATGQLESQRSEREEMLESIEKMSGRIAALEPMRKIRQLDVALDTILTATKLTLALLLTFIRREYLPSAQMSAETFLHRVLTVRGHREVRSQSERIVFYENPRDPRATTALAEACEHLNERCLVREGRALNYAVEPRPP